MTQLPPAATTMSCRWQHLVDLAGQDLKATIGFLTLGVRGGVHDGHVTALTPVFERTLRTVRLQFVVLDEIDPAADQRLDEIRSRGGREPDRRLDDGADQREFFHSREPARPVRPEGRPGISVEKRLRQL